MTCCLPPDGSRGTSARLTELALSAQAGDAEAYDELARRCRKQFRAWLKAQWHSAGLPAYQRDDLLAEAEFVLANCVAAFRKGGRFLAYLQAAVFRAWRRAWGRRRSEQDQLTLDAPRRMSDERGRLTTALHALADNGVPDAVPLDASEAVEAILGKIPKPAAALVRMVYGIGVGADGKQRQPRKVKDLERAHGFGRNVLHERLRGYLQDMRAAAEEAGLATF